MADVVRSAALKDAGFAHAFSLRDGGVSDAPFGIAMVPFPNGQIPAMARKRVDFPEPDGPVTSVRSPLRNSSTTV